MSSDRRFSGNTEIGAALVEFAFVLPILLALIVGTIYYGYAFMISASVAHAADQAAQAAVSVSPAGLSSAEYSDAVAAATSRVVRESLDWLPQNLAADAASLTCAGSEQAFPCDGALRVFVAIPFSTSESSLLPQIDLPVLGRFPPLPITLTGTAEVIL